MYRATEVEKRILQPFFISFLTLQITNFFRLNFAKYKLDVNGFVSSEFSTQNTECVDYDSLACS